MLAQVRSHVSVPTALLVVDEERSVGLEPDRLAGHETELVGFVLWERHSLLRTFVNTSNTPEANQDNIFHSYTAQPSNICICLGRGRLFR